MDGTLHGYSDGGDGAAAEGVPGFDTIVVGAGLAGLTCARALTAAGRAVALLEKSDGPGGRVRTDVVDGFRLDRGFQVLLTGYPEPWRHVDRAALDLRPFESGSLVRAGGRFHAVMDPARHPFGIPGTLLAPVGGLADKLRVAWLKAAISRGDLDDIWTRPDTDTLAYLRAAGFSEGMIDRFFRPFLGGVQIDRSLSGSSRSFEFVFRMFGADVAAVPARGMGALPDALAATLPAGCLRTKVCVGAVEWSGGGGGAGRWLIRDGEGVATATAARVVVAAESPAARRLVAWAADGTAGPGGGGGRGTPTADVARWLAAPPDAGKHAVTVWFDAPADPLGRAILALDGDSGPSDHSPVNHLAVMSRVSPELAPPDRHLIAANAVGGGWSRADDNVLLRVMLDRAAEWFGPAAAAAWRPLRIDRIRHAQPTQPPGGTEAPGPRDPRTGLTGLYLAGDHHHDASINGAMLSGRLAAEAVLADE